MLDFEEEEVQPFRVTPGFIAFVAVMLLPLVAALVIFAGASLVASEVQAAEVGRIKADGRIELAGEGQHVAGWKRTLVGVCPVH